MERLDTLIDDDCELDDSCEASNPDCEKVYTECICPKCGVRHKLKLCWTGWGVPRKYCNACRKSAYIYDFEEFFPVHIDSK